MAKYFDENKWIKAIKYNDWYLQISDDYKNLIKKAEESSLEMSKEIKEELYQFFERHIKNKSIALGKDGPNWDEERKSVDIIVIHHTKNSPGITWQRLSAMQLIRLYATYYASTLYEKERHIKGQAIYSNHFKDSEQVFYAYHWLVRMDGSVERLLGDGEIGWQAGNWDVNCRSVAICLDNDFENSSPSDLVLSAIVKLIKEHYPRISPENIKGHREVNLKTTCPGNKFLNGWKEKLIAMVT
ncbi:MAG: peptidoglycan recognition family protein [bacterium]